jgi:hypothetical protein
VTLNYGIHSRAESYAHSELLSLIQMNKLRKLPKNKKIFQDDPSLFMVKMSDEQNGSNTS